MTETLRQPRGEMVLRTLAMPSDTNPNGDIFGGWLMSQMDLAASTTAALCAGGRCATVAIDRVVFHRPVSVGDEVSIYTHLTKQGRTSMTIAVEAWRRVRRASQRQKVTEGHFVFVALDENGRPRPVDAP